MDNALVPIFAISLVAFVAFFVGLGVGGDVMSERLAKDCESTGAMRIEDVGYECKRITSPRNEP